MTDIDFEVLKKKAWEHKRIAEFAVTDELYDQAVQVVLRDKKVSTSYVQRRLGVGYNKAATLIERMENEGLISSPNGQGKREILVPGDSARP